MKTFEEFISESERKGAFRRVVSTILTPWGKWERDPRVKFKVTPRKPREIPKTTEMEREDE